MKPMIAGPGENRTAGRNVSPEMTTLAGRLRGALFVLLVSALVACTPGAGGTSAPSAGGGGTAPSAPGGAAPSAVPSSVGGPGAGY
jgi:hypothetical protein